MILEIEKKDTKLFLHELKQLGYLDTNEYDFSEVNYVNETTKVKIRYKKLNTIHTLIPSTIRKNGIIINNRNAVNKTDYFIKKSKEIHGDKYDYVNVIFINSTTNVSIKCLTCNDTFPQTPNKHLSNQGCPTCNGSTKYTTESFIKKVSEKHNNFYDYSKFKYNNSRTASIVICPKHGEFPITPTHHLSGSGCNICHNSKHTKQDFVKRCVEKYGDKYDYTNSDFVDMSTSIKIKCKKDDHGEFPLLPSSHINGSECPICKGRKINTRIFIEKAKEIHGDKYDYLISDYKGNNKLIEIICKKHGKYKTKPKLHLDGGGTCSKCKSNKKDTTKSFIKKAKEVHGHKYDYSILNYTGSKNEVTIICKKHGPFPQIAHSHLSGYGCYTCNLGWTTKKAIEFISTMRDVINSLHIQELNSILSSNGLDKKISKSELNILLSTRQHSEERENQVNRILDLMSKSLKESDDIEGDDSDKDDVINKETEDNQSNIDSIAEDIDILQVKESTYEELLEEFEKLENDKLFLDKDSLDFLVEYRKSLLWKQVLDDISILDKLKEKTELSFFENIKSLFFEEYNKVIDINPPKGYIFEYEPSLMQKLLTYRIGQRGKYGNWSGTGAGKTLSAIFAGRYHNLKTTLIICNNSTVEGWSKAIKEYFSDSNVYTKETHDLRKLKLDENRFNYIIINYETFQQGRSVYLSKMLSDNNKFDYVILDEIQYIKERKNIDVSKRKKVINQLISSINKKNKNLYILGMSATPVINDLHEVKSLLELITRKKLPKLHTENTIINALNIYQELIKYGIRYRPNFDINTNIIHKENRINAEDNIELIRKITSNKKDVITTEKMILPYKLDIISDDIKKGTLIYTYYVKDILQEIGDFVNNKGLTYGFYTGENKEGLDKFKRGEIDVLIGSAPISTGVDGIQKVCNRIIPIILPWTSAQYKQLIGRCVREGSNFDEVDIIIPRLTISDKENFFWSWDKRKFNLIEYKSSLSDLVLDGTLPRGTKISLNKFVQDAKNKLYEWIELLKKSKGIDDSSIEEYEKFDEELDDELDRKKSQYYNEFTEFNRKWNTQKSSTLHDKLKKSPDEWYKYHDLYGKSRESWVYVPFIEIAKDINKTSNPRLVADLGCGENLLSKEIDSQHNVIGFDHVAIDSDVVVSDINNIDKKYLNKFDIAVFSLALMGVNHRDYIQSAYDILTMGGKLYVVEAKNRWDNDINMLAHLIEENDNFVIIKKEGINNFLYIEAIKK